ncbi:MAG TPA: T9SS type A sorting domain-containing protein, partial [Chryseolinea sp.]|nr:T9SS type A sorting domain-containing protein [Chryseolinea sp.]
LNLGLSASDYVNDLALDGTTLYVAGSFTTVSGGGRSNVAAVNAATGALSNWNPVTQDYVGCVVPSAAGVWIGGSFKALNGTFHNGFVLIEEATNTPWPFQVDIGGTVNTIAVKDNIVYLGGQFNSINKTARTNLAALDLRTGTLLAWDPRAYGLSTTDRTASVNSIKIKDNLLFTGGRFYAINAMATIRPGLAAVDLATGAATSWNPLVGDGKTINQYVNCIDIVDNTLYAAGAFNLLNLSVTRNNLAAISTANANILAWDPNSSGEVFRVRATPSTVYVTGSFQGGIGGAMRPYNLAALEATTGKATLWNPELDGTAYDVAIGGSNIYVAGYFSTVFKEFRPGLASFLMADGSLNDWTPDIGDDGDGGYSTFTLSTSTSRLFVGGNFTQLGNEARQYYGEFDLCPSKPAVTLSGTTLSTIASGELQWYANGDAVDGATGPTFDVNPLEYGLYVVSVTQYGCEIFSDDAIYVVTALESTRDEALKAYPNPVEDELTLELAPTNDALDITITDIMGRVMRTEKNTDTRALSFAGYRPGPYLLIIQTGNVRYVKKIMKIR